MIVMHWWVLFPIYNHLFFGNQRKEEMDGWNIISEHNLYLLHHSVHLRKDHHHHHYHR